MAEEWPEAEIVGVDLVLPTRYGGFESPQGRRNADGMSRVPPANCIFEADDVTLGMSHYQAHFDLVHARAVSHGVSSSSGILI